MRTHLSLEHLGGLKTDTDVFMCEITQDREHFTKLNNLFSHCPSLTLILLVLAASSIPPLLYVRV